MRHAPIQPQTELQYPLTQRALREAFSALSPLNITLSSRRGNQEGCIDGAWSLTRLRIAFRDLGFRPCGRPEALLFANEQETVGLQCMGVDAHPTKNTWRTYCIEVQARPSATGGVHASPGLLSL